jgi:hypothetical protein
LSSAPSSLSLATGVSSRRPTRLPFFQGGRKSGYVIEVAFGAIRRKLGDRSSAIETVRGMGNRLAASV